MTWSGALAEIGTKFGPIILGPGTRETVFRLGLGVRGTCLKIYRR